MAAKTKKKPKPSKKPKAPNGPERSGPAVNGPPQSMCEVLTLADAAAFLRVSEDGLKADAAAGRVPGRFVAEEWRFVKETLLAWLSQPEPRPSRLSSDLVEHLKKTAQPWTPETEREAEAFISWVQSARKADSVGE